MTKDRTDPPLRADELTTLLGFLNYHRATLQRKAEGLDHDQLGRTHPPSTLTLAGLLKHVALNESHWFGYVLHDRPLPEPFASADWDADIDWELTTAVQDSPAELHRLMDNAVRTADAGIAEAYAAGGLDQPSARPSRDTGEPFSLHWILLHMIEEYARHNGHADLIRESIDGATGE
ncbi:DinB family protein [Microlunatus sp. GCM10028923]|uniref:DinB family protein n=1 Tax=Microlunatus sp. GCM10028923 TaxID=3273400 RepID=UPI00361EDFC9